MNAFRLLVLLPLTFTLAVLHGLPFMPGRNRLFGVALAREVRYGVEGRTAVRRYELRLLPWTAAALLCALALPLSWAVYWACAASLIPLIAAGRLFSREREAIRSFALPAPSTREARLTGEDSRLVHHFLPFVIPLCILAGTALYLHLRWEDIPARFPVHWGLDGKPNGWSTRTVGGVYGPLVLGAAIVLLMSAIPALVSWGSRRNAQHPAVQLVPIAVACVVAGGFSMAGLLPLYVVPLWGLALFYALAFTALGLVIWRSLRRRGAHRQAAEVTPDDCWHWDLFYYNPEDPALFVEKRIGLGWTLNFGNRLSWFVLAAFVVVPVGLVIVAIRLTKH